MNLPGYDAWKTTESDDRTSSPAVSYTCLDCDWRGKALGAFQHHQHEGHHRISLKGNPGLRMVFSCCSGGSNGTTRANAATADSEHGSAAGRETD